MQRALLCVKSAVRSEFSGPNSFWSLQFVRWGRKQRMRKPLSLGTAKTKLFRFEPPKVYAPGEEEEIKKLYSDYRANMKSMYNYFKEEYAKISDTSELAAENARLEEKEHRRLMEENRLENERLAKIREVRLKKELEAKREILTQMLAEREEMERKRIQEADEIIRFFKSQPVITAEKLDEAIDSALEVELDYNYAIDLHGNIYRGRHKIEKDRSKDTTVQPMATELKT